MAKLIEVVKKKNKAGVTVKPFQVALPRQHVSPQQLCSRNLIPGPFEQVKNHIWVFVNALIENPSFDSQTKENMTLQTKSFGSKCPLSDKFIRAVRTPPRSPPAGGGRWNHAAFPLQATNCGIVESILNWVKFKAQTQLNKKCSSVKHSKIKGIPKLDDANDAGERARMKEERRSRRSSKENEWRITNRSVH